MYDFEWHPGKAASNLLKHGIDFDVAATVFQYPFALSVRDEYHSETERWITMGESHRGRLLVVVHTVVDRGPDHDSYHFGAAGHGSRAAAVRVRQMKREYDFSKGERGKFYREGAKLKLPSPTRQPPWADGEPHRPLHHGRNRKDPPTLRAYQAQPNHVTENANLEHGIAHGGYAHRQLFELTNFEGRPRAWLHHKALTTGRMAKIDRLCGSRRALTWNPRALRFVTMKMKSADEWDDFWMHRVR